jgi:membrane-bound lytic murein transglycosylase F
MRTFGACFLLGLIVGCSPVSENLVKKAQNGSREVSYQATPTPEQAESISFLSEADRLVIKSYGGVVKRYSEEYGLDWRLVMAVMKAESGFAPDAQSDKGASGLMQIMPTTGEEVARTLAIRDIAHPRNNIRGGVFYLRKLYDLFEGADETERIKLALAAYNAGVGRIYDAQVLSAYLNDNPQKWESIKEALPLLSKRYYTLHKSVWDQDHPRIAGWFGGSRETITYVARVMGYYEEYKTVLN